MSKIKVGINGFGRIGRMVTRAILAKYANQIEVVGVNDLTDTATLAHLFKYYSSQGTFKGQVKADGDQLNIDGTSFKVTAERDPVNLNWGDLGVDVVVESSPAVPVVGKKLSLSYTRPNCNFVIGLSPASLA